jgi:transposase-like protein
MCDLTNPAFTNEDKAREFLEASRWPDGPVCPFCGQLDTVAKLGGMSMGPGWYYCSGCRDKFTVRVGTLYGRSHIPLHKWLFATHLITSSKKGMSALQLSRMLGLSYKSAWFMCHRIREGMTPLNPLPIGGQCNVVEADETFFGGKAKNRAYAKREPKKHAGMTLVDRDGESRSFHVANVKAKTLRETIVKVASRKSYLMTDELASYEKVGRSFSGHGTVNHSVDENVRLGLRACQHCRVSFQPHETRGVWHAPFDQRSSFAALSSGMGFQVEHPQDRRRGTCGNSHRGYRR